jgi:fungal STAND N-terminal Goodbye domain
MSSTGQATSSASSFQLIIEAALVDYKKETGIDLSKTPFAAALEQSNSPEAILQLLHDREIAFKEYRDGNRRLINCLGPVVKAIHALSGIIGEAVSLVSLTSSSGDFLTRPRQIHFPPAKAIFAAIDTLLAVRPFSTLFKWSPRDK